MNGQTEKIKRISDKLRRAFWAVGWGIPVGVLLFWLNLNVIHEYVQIPMFALPVYPVTVSVRIGGWVISMVSLSCVTAISFLLSRLFWRYARGIIFTKENSQIVRRIAGLILIYVPLSVAVRTSLVYLLSSQRAARFEISVSTTELGYLLLGSTVWVISWIMEEARAIKNESDLTI